MAGSQPGSTTGSSLASQWVPSTDSPGLAHPTVLLEIFFSRRQSQVFVHKTVEPAESSANETTGLAFPGSHSHFIFKTSVSLRRHATGLSSTAQENVFMYVYMYIHTYTYIHTHSLYTAMSYNILNSSTIPNPPNNQVRLTSSQICYKCGKTYRKSTFQKLL